MHCHVCKRTVLSSSYSFLQKKCYKCIISSPVPLQKSSNKEKKEIRKNLNDLVDDFLAKGGKIECIGPPIPDAKHRKAHPELFYTKNDHRCR